jgi:hypothetical protein
VIARVVLWNLAETRTTIDELRDRLPLLEPPSAWIWNEAADRFGLLAFDEGVPEDALVFLRSAIGVDAVVYEEFDVLD